MRANELVLEHAPKDQLLAAVAKHGGNINDYFVRFTDVDQLGFSAKQKFGRSPDLDDPKFDIDYIGAGHGRPALWFYPLKFVLKNREAYATDMPYAWLVKLKSQAWLQPVKSGDRAIKSPPQGQQRVGILRMSNPPAAIFFSRGFDVIGRYYNYAQQHRRHGQVKGSPKTWFNKVRGLA